MEPATKKQRLDALLRRGAHLAAAQRREEQRLGAHEKRQAQALRLVPEAAAEAERSTRWSAREDAQLARLVAERGTSDWRGVAAALGPARDRKRCRERWANHVGARRAPWTREEDERLRTLHARLGSKWARIARELGGRAPDDVKNRMHAAERSLHRGEQADERRGGGESERPAGWTREETEELRALVRKHGPSNWLLIASQLHAGRTDQQCLQHWHRVADTTIVKGKGSWSQEEDAVLLAKVRELGRNWAQIATFLPGRVGKQCRERYLNHVDPTLKKEPWTPKEDEILQEEYVAHGPHWVEIAKALPGRSANAIKNRWYTTKGHHEEASKDTDSHT